MATAPIIIRHIEGRRSERVAWLLEELGVPYTLDFIAGDIFGSLVELEKHHEMRMAPIVHIGDVVMVESGAILEYILSRHGRDSGLRVAEDSPDYPYYLEFMHFAEGTAMAKVLTDAAEHNARQAFRDAGIEPPSLGLPKLPGLAGSRTGAQRILHYAESTLARRPYFGGERFTAANIMMHFPLKLGAVVATGGGYTIRSMQTPDQAYLHEVPRVKDFLQRMANRPAFQRAMRSTMPNGAPAM